MQWQCYWHNYTASATTWALGAKLNEKKDKGCRKDGRLGKKWGEEEEERRQMSRSLFNHDIRLSDEKQGGNRDIELEKIG